MFTIDDKDIVYDFIVVICKVELLTFDQADDMAWNLKLNEKRASAS